MRNAALLKKSPLALALAIALGQPALAALNEVDPGDANGDYLEENGFFAGWYQDTHGRTLDLCLTKTVSSRVAPDPVAGPSYMCVFPGIDEGFDAAEPVAFPGNFPVEAFWFSGDAAITDAASGIDLSYTSAIEAFFMTDEIEDGQQVSFARIRIRVDVPTPGVYTVTHPYGVEVFDVTQDVFDDTGGGKAINMTRDLGIGAPGTFRGALEGDVGPFLRSLNGPYLEVNPVTGQQETYIGDPNLEEAVTGSPFATNFVRIEGPGGIDVRTDLFSVSGKLSSVNLPTPLKIDRATYSRRDEGGTIVAQQDVFTQAPPPPGTSLMRDSAGAEGPMSETTATGHWYAQSTTNPGIPGQVQLTADNSLAIANSQVTVKEASLVDQITIRKAEFSGGNLNVEAATSDETAEVTLTAYTQTGALIGALSGSGAVKTLSTNISPVVLTAIEIRSSNGGSDTEEVIFLP